MKLHNLHDATTIAVQRSFTSKNVVDVFKSGTGFKVQLAAFRSSKKFEKRMSYENGKVIITDMEGKKLDTVEAPKKSSKKPAGNIPEVPKP